MISEEAKRRLMATLAGEAQQHRGPVLEESLQAFLNDVWGRKDELFFEPYSPKDGRAGFTTLENRIYDRCYAAGRGPKDMQNAASKMEALTGQLMHCCGNFGFYFDKMKRQPGDFEWFSVSGGGIRVTYRVYLNPKVGKVGDLMLAVFAKAKTAPISSVKFAVGKQQDRPDRVVVYIGDDEAGAVNLARELAGGPFRYRNETPPFTRMVAPGVAIGPEPSSELIHKVGGSFGEVRCNLVAQALFHALTNLEYGRAAQRKGLPFFEDGAIMKLKVPLDQVLLKNTLIDVSEEKKNLFLQYVVDLFRKRNIDPQQPWRDLED